MYKRILTMQDISCLGQCSLTVALPILSACGIETAILPSAILSTHTAGFKNFTVRDLSNDIPGIINHWKDESIDFDALYTGYLGEIEHIDMVLSIVDNLLKKDAKVIIDPAMADNGKLYPAFNNDYVDAMKRLIAVADYTLPNITEAAFLTGTEYKESYDESYIKKLADGLEKLGAKNVIITGATYDNDSIGVFVREDGVDRYYKHKKINENRHGTGDIYSSAFVGALLKGKDSYEAAKIASDFTVLALEETLKEEEHLYGAKFELVLDKLIQGLK